MSPFVLDKTSPVYSFKNTLTSPPPSIEDAFSFTTYNAACGKKLGRITNDFVTNPRLRGTGVILLQEIEAHPHEITSQAEKIARQCGYTGIYAPARREIRNGYGGTHGLAILSKFPLSDTDVFELPRFDLGKRTRRRICVTAKVHLPSGEFVRIYNVHLDTRINAEDRIKQLQPVIDDALRYPDEKVIIAGDVNTITFDEWSSGKMFRKWLPKKLWVESQRIRVDLHMKENGFAFPELQRGSYTLNSWLQKMLLDAIYVRNLTINNYGIEYGARGSDHFPLWATAA